MANTTGTAADYAALATAVNTFLTANGWTQNRFDTQGTGRRLELQKTYTQGTATLTMTAGLRFSNAENVSPFSPGSKTGVFLVCGTSYSGAADWHSQTGSPLFADAASRGGVAAEMAAASIVYYIFNDSTNRNVVIVVQKSATVWNYLCWGMDFTKYGAWTGGPYFAGSRSGYELGSGGTRADSVTVPALPPFFAESSAFGCPSFVRIDEGGFGEEWRGNNDRSVSTNARTTRSLLGWGLVPLNALGLQSAPVDGVPNMAHLFARSRSALTNNSLLFPLSVSTYNVAATRWRPIGYAPTVRACYIRGNINPGVDITVGAKTYTVFEGFAVEKV